MGEFTHAMRNPIRERDDRIAALERDVARLEEREADLVKQNVALMGALGQRQEELEQLRADAESAAEWQFTDGRGELNLSDGWKATVCSHAGTYAWSVHNAKTAEYGVGTASSWSEARRQALEAVKR